MDRLLFGRAAALENLPHRVQALEKPLQEAIRAAHIAKGIRPEQFVKGLSLLGKGFAPEEEVDPYRLPLRVCLAYLCCGGLQIVGQEGAQMVYATDQDSFFDFFGIEYHYDGVAERPCGRMLKAGAFSSAMLRLHRMATVTDSNDRYSPYSPQELDAKILVLMEVLRPLCDTRWGYQAVCEMLMAQLVQDHLAAMDTENEAECCYRKAVSLCREQGFDLLPSDEAMDCLHRASVLGHSQATLMIGLRALELGQWYDGEEPAYAILQEAAKLGCPWAGPLAEAFMPHYPSGESYNWKPLIHCLHRRAEKRTMEKYALGYCYLQRAKYGSDPIGDTQAAIHWLERAVQEGSQAAGALLVEVG